jgi:predicted Zn-ribbon and HTH transcriptional regulator
MFQQIEPNLRYCLECGDEYRSEIRVCANCGKELIDGSRVEAIMVQQDQRHQARSREITPDEEVVTIRKGPTLQIKQVQAYLLERSVPSLLISEQGSNCGKGCCGTELLLQVRRDDIEEVMTILEQEYRITTGLEDFDTTYTDAVYDTNAEQATCPACGYSFSTKSSTCPDCGLCFG